MNRFDGKVATFTCLRSHAKLSTRFLTIDSSSVPMCVGFLLIPEDDSDGPFSQFLPCQCTTSLDSNSRFATANAYCLANSH